MSDQAEHETLGNKPRPNRGQQARNRQKQTRKAKTHKAKFIAKRAAPKFLYLCKCHGQRATKPPCERANDDIRENKFSESPHGTWNCSVTHQKCKVDRCMPEKPKEESNETLKNEKSNTV
jgi:hypothetical protein